MKICVIGTGYVGLVSGACFADLGNVVLCTYKNKKKFELLNNRLVPFYEPGLEALLKRNIKAKRLNFSSNLKMDSTFFSRSMTVCIAF